MRNALLVILLAGGSWAFFRNFEIDGLDGIKVRPRGAAVADASREDLKPYLPSLAAWDAETTGPDESPSWIADAPPPSSDAAGPAGTVAQPVGFGFWSAKAAGNEDADSRAAPAAKRFEPVRVASWALGGFDKGKAAKRHVMGLLARIVRTFDLVAIQQISGRQRDLLPRMVEHINRSGRKFDYLLGAPPLKEDDGEQLAFIFDTQRIVTDRSQFYTVADPEGRLKHDPIVGWFRTVGPPASQAWTFSVINVRVDMDRAAAEVAVLPRVLKAVRNDGRGEDDCIVAGLFQADDAYLKPTFGGDRVLTAIEATPTDIFGKHQVSNLVLPADEVIEYLGGGGVVNFLRIHNLTLAECEELTPHLPVYAEFNPVEGAD